MAEGAADLAKSVALIHFFLEVYTRKKTSNSGFQRLSQAALPRFRFLQLTAGALLPFIGSRLSAAAALNPELAQNSGAPGTKDAAAPAAWGHLVSPFGPAKIHS
jgi:hypothetical protein